MSVILILILASLLVALLFLAGFIWSVRSGQYEDTTTPSMRILMDDERIAIRRCSTNARLPLTLTLSRREREQQPDSSGFTEALRATTESRDSINRRTILPLPAGEGRGEGESHENQPRSSAPDGQKPNTDFNNL
jgi:cbb3-type cytochrome oxidase maturation protein